MLKQEQTQKQGQKLLSKIVLNQNMLALPAIALDNLVKRELEQNPLLEEGPDSENELTDDALLNEEKDQPDEDLIRDNPSPAQGDEASAAGDERDSDSDGEKNDPDNEFNWDEYFENESEEYASYNTGGVKPFDYGNIADDGNRLQESLILQLHFSDLPPKIEFIAEEIVWSLNDDGMLAEIPENILADLTVKKAGTDFENETFTHEEFDIALDFIHKNLDPPGIGARDLKECLLIQIERGRYDNHLKALASEAVAMHFDDIANKRFEKLEKHLKATPDEMREVFELLHKLNPKPGYSDAAEPENYIVPDLIVKGRDGTYDVFLNERFTPLLRVNSSYKDLYLNKRKTLDNNARTYLTNNFNRAKWFIDAVNSRRDTMIKIMEAVVRRQKLFFDSSGEELKPLLEKDIAEEIGMDTSTVSRAVKNKYVQTDFGIFDMRSFFTSHMQNSDGEDISNAEVKLKLKQLIASENKENPLTDLELASELSKSGYKIARRTVTKYRESLDIPIAKLRREIVQGFEED